MAKFLKVALVTAKWLMYMVFLLLAAISLAFIESDPMITLFLLSPIIVYVGIKVVTRTVKSKQGVMALLFCAGIVELVWVGTTLSWFYLVIFIFGVLVFNFVEALMALELRLIRPSSGAQWESDDNGWSARDSTARDSSPGSEYTNYSEPGLGGNVTGSGYTASGQIYVGVP